MVEASWLLGFSAAASFGFPDLYSFLGSACCNGGEASSTAAGFTKDGLVC